MKIINTSGEILNETPDYSKGRLLQSKDDSETYVYTTYEEIPQGQGNGESEI